MTSDITKINGLNIRYLRIDNNAKDYLVFLHGWGGSLESWQKFLKKFENAKVNVLFFDLPGFGKSEAQKEVWGVNEYTDFVDEVVKHFQLEKFYLFGHSFGGQLAVNYAFKYPEKLSGLFLSGSAVIRQKPNIIKKLIKPIAKVLKVFLPKSARQILYRLLGNLDYGKLDNPIMKQSFNQIIRQDIRHLLPDIKTKTHIIWGRNDTYTPLKHGQLINDLLPDSTFQVVEARHGIHLSAPDKLYEFIFDSL